MDATVRDAAIDWHLRSVPAVVVEIDAVRGSTPREAGTRMLVAAQRSIGTIGGGRLEQEAIAIARAALADPSRGLPGLRDFPLGAALGQCCGGHVRLRFAFLSACMPRSWAVDPPLFHLQLHGAGHVGRALVEALAPLPCEIDWIDERADAWRDAVPAVAGTARLRTLCVDAPQSEVAAAPVGALLLVMTHSHALDEQICEAALQRDDLRLIGLIGSSSKRARFERRWRARGLPSDRIARLVCPIGLPGIEGKQPAVIAASVVAQLLLVAAAADARPDVRRISEAVVS